MITHSQPKMCCAVQRELAVRFWDGSIRITPLGGRWYGGLWAGHGTSAAIPLLYLDVYFNVGHLLAKQTWLRLYLIKMYFISQNAYRRSGLMFLTCWGFLVLRYRFCLQFFHCLNIKIFFLNNWSSHSFKCYSILTDIILYNLNCNSALRQLRKILFKK